MNKRDTTGFLSAAEHQQRVAAAHSHRHHAETAVSVRQGSTGEPSKAAIGLFRQGQQRSDTRASRSVWDTRTTEQPVGSMNARFRLHLPKAHLDPSVTPLAAHMRGRPLLAETMAAPGKISGSRKKVTTSPYQDLTIENPGSFVEAMRHPKMVQILQRSIGLVREHQKSTVERGFKKGLIPKGTPPGLAARAYKHAALMAVHKVGVGHYHFAMDPAMQREMQPLRLFMQYAHRRIFDRLHTENPPETFEPFKREFGEKFSSRKHGKLTGTERYRMSPNNVFIKIEEPMLGKAFNAAKHKRDLQGRWSRTKIGRSVSEFQSKIKDDKPGGENNLRIAGMAAGAGAGIGITPTVGLATQRARTLLRVRPKDIIPEHIGGAAGGAMAGLFIGAAGAAAYDKVRGRKYMSPELDELHGTKNGDHTPTWGEIGALGGTAALFGGMALMRRPVGSVLVQAGAGLRHAIIHNLPGIGQKVRRATVSQLRSKIREARQAGETIVYRGAPTRTDFAPQKRSFQAVYVAQNKPVTRGYGTDMSRVGSTSVFGLKPGTKLLDTSSAADMSDPIYAKVLGPDALQSSPAAMLPGFVVGRMNRMPLYSLHVDPSKAQAKILQAEGYHGTVGQKKNIALFDESRLRPLYAQSRFHGGVKFAKGFDQMGLRKDWTNATGVIASPGRGPTDQAGDQPPGKIRDARLKQALRHGHGVRLSLGGPVPEPPGGLPPPPHPAHHVKHAARHVERHFGVGKIEGAAFPDPEMQKVSGSFLLGDLDPQPSYGNYSTSAATQLRRAMRPRTHRRQKAFRMNANQRGMRRMLSGGITREERWLLGARPGQFEASKGGDFTDADLSKGIIGSAMQFGATHLKPLLSRIGGAAMAGAKEAKAAIGGGIKRTGSAALDSRAGQAATARVKQVAATPTGQRVLASPRVQALHHEVKAFRAGGFREGVGANVGGFTGAAIGGRRGAKIGRTVGFASEYTPYAVAAGLGVKHMLGSDKKKVEKISPRMMFGAGIAAVGAKRIGAKIMAHPRVGPVLRELAEQGAPKTPLWRLGRLVGASVGGERGARIGGHIGRAAEVGPLAIGGAHMLINRQRRNKETQKQVARLKALPGTLLGKNSHPGAARDIYTNDINETIRAHVRSLSGGGYSPHQLAQARAILAASRRHAQSRAQPAPQQSQ